MDYKKLIKSLVIVSFVIGTQVQAVELNEYIDPSTNPKYTQNYNEIQFGEEGISYNEILELNEVVNILENQEEIPKVMMEVEQII